MAERGAADEPVGTESPWDWHPGTMALAGRSGTDS